jgi:hypothetical protein
MLFLDALFNFTFVFLRYGTSPIHCGPNFCSICCNTYPQWSHVMQNDNFRCRCKTQATESSLFILHIHILDLNTFCEPAASHRFSECGAKQNVPAFPRHVVSSCLAFLVSTLLHFSRQQTLASISNVLASTSKMLISTSKHSD